MKQFMKRRPSAAMIVAIVALVAALGGTAIAGGGLVTKTKFKKFKKNTNANLATKVAGPITYANRTEAVNTSQAPVNSNGQTITAACPSGQHAVGGGVKSGTNTGQSTLFVQQSYPSSTGYTATVFAGFGAAPGTPEQITVTAVCEGGTTSGAPPAVTP